LLQVLVSAVSPAGLMTTFYCLRFDRDSPNLEDQVPIFISPRNRVTQLYPRALGSLFVASTRDTAESESELLYD
jgi:hypothetical protein